MKNKTFGILLLAIGAATMMGVSISQAATFTAAATGDWNLGATWGNAGNDVAGSGYPGSADIAIINSAGRIVTVNATTEACTTLTITSGTVQNNGTLTVSGNTTGAGSLIQGASSTLNLGGTFTVTTVSATASGNAVNYTGAGQQVKVTAYQNLGFSGSGTYTWSATGAKTISGNWNITGTEGLTGNAGTITVGGNMSFGTSGTFANAGGNDNFYTITGDLAISAGTLNIPNQALGLSSVGGTTTLSGGSLVFGGQSAAPTFTGLVTVSGGTVNFANSSPTFAGGLTYSSGTIAASGGTWNFSGTGKAITGTFTIPAILGVTSGATITLNGTVTITRSGTGNVTSGTGTLTMGANSTLIAGNGPMAAITLNCTANTPNTVQYNYTSGSSTTVFAANYYNFIINAASAYNFSGSTIANNLTVNAVAATVSTWPGSSIGGTLAYSSTAGTTTFPAAFSIGALNQTAGTLAVSAGQTLTVTGTGAGTWTRSAGTFNANATSTVKFTGTAPDIGGAVATAFGKLLIDSTATTATASGTAFTVATALIINPSGQLDISALSGSSLTLGASAALTNSGTIKGSIVTGATGKVFAGTDGGYGTSTIALTPTTGDLSLTSGSTVNLDVNSTAAAANDLLAVGGTLTLNSTVFNLKAPSNGATIDTANDYTLATASTISGTPVLNWVTGFVPANSTDYVLVVSGGTVKLHDTAVVPVGSPVLTAAVSGSTLTLSWDSTTFPGYSVQAQTNSASAGLGASWTDTGSGTVSPYMTTIDPANPTVFYRLAHP